MILAEVIKPKPTHRRARLLFGNPPNHKTGGDMAKKSTPKKANKKEIRKEKTATKKAGIPERYYNPTHCNTCSYESTVRREGVVCMHDSTLPEEGGTPCQGILVKTETISTSIP